MPEARRLMVVDHADGLHEGVGDHRPAELETARLQGLGHGEAFGGLGRGLAEMAPLVHKRLAADEGPQPGREILAAIPHVQPDAGAVDGGVDLGV